MRSLPRKWPIILGAVVLLPTALVLMYKPILLGLGDFLIVQDDLQPADLIHVLGGGFDRLDYAVELYRQGYGRQIFVTGGEDAVVYRAYVVAKGVRPEDLWPLESKAESTYEEALELKQFLDDETSIGLVIIVSNPYHMRRARWTFQKVLGNQVTFQFAPVPFGLARYKRCWWTDAGSVKTVMSEFLKIPYYYLKY